MKYWALKFATDAAVTVLRVDQVRKKAHSTSGFIIICNGNVCSRCTHSQDQTRGNVKRYSERNHA